MAWYQVVTEVNKIHQAGLEEEYDSYTEAKEQADALASALNVEMDIGSWTIMLNHHLCDKNGSCECRFGQTPYARFEGMKIPFRWVTV